MSAPEGGLAKKADELRAKRGGSAKSTDEQRARWREEKRVQREKRTTSGAPEATREPYVADPTSIMLSGILGATIFNLATRIGHHRQLTPEETQQLGEALDPVLWKWLPVLGDWKAEAGLAIVCLSLWQATTPPKGEDDGSASVETAGRGSVLSEQGG